MADTKERLNRTMSLEGALSRFSLGLESIAADAKALESGIGYHVKFFDDEKQAVANAEKAAREASEQAGRIMGIASELLWAVRRDRADERARAAASLGNLLATSGARIATANEATTAACSFLRELARDANWRCLEAIDGNRIRQLIVWQGPGGSGDERHPAWLAARTLMALLGEPAPTGSGSGYDLRRGIGDPEPKDEDEE